MGIFTPFIYGSIYLSEKGACEAHALYIFMGRDFPTPVFYKLLRNLC